MFNAPVIADIKTYLDESPVEVLYISFGSNFNTFELPAKTLQTKILTKVFTNIPYNISKDCYYVDFIIDGTENSFLENAENDPVMDWWVDSDPQKMQERIEAGERIEESRHFFFSYEQNVIKLRNIINDHPMSALERAVWWTEHVLRHGGARHLKTPAAGMDWADDYELNLLLTVLFCILGAIVPVILCIHVSIKLIFKSNNTKEKTI
ncbi:UDP-glycosyltransferase UGT4-like [Cydia pomonella]|uniref:UDP-glycosyltransferase UGT4-like n=1 Tax=Cydia pomonella TaxID=82600 RepID=UPI002ADDE532|nr:UDP-glycosyltransferase UGT4-like [Cydia pomonella]